MTWEEFCEKAKKFGYYLCGIDDSCLESDNIQFFKNGTVCKYIYVEDDYYNKYYPIAWDRTPDQMYQIMVALRMKDVIIETAEDIQKIRKIEQLQKKLDIATKALEELKPRLESEDDWLIVARALNEIDLAGISAKEE